MDSLQFQYLEMISFRLILQANLDLREEVLYGELQPVRRKVYWMKINSIFLNSFAMKSSSPVSSQWLEVNDFRFDIESHADNTVRKIEAIIPNVNQWSA